MPFIDSILTYSSLSVVGLAKNTGKTETLNYIIRHMQAKSVRLGITSIGVDGEQKDACFGTSKPEIEIAENTFFSTSELYYRIKKIDAEIWNVSLRQTSLGRLITACSKSSGKLILSGPSTTLWLKEELAYMHNIGADLCIVDGALSRLSLSSPSITDSMILATGAALATTINEVVKKTKYICDLIKLPIYISSHLDDLIAIEQGVYGLNQGELTDLKMTSLFGVTVENITALEVCHTVFIAGALTEHFMNLLTSRKLVSDFKLIVKDFTKIFINSMTLNYFFQKGFRLYVLQKPHLLAITINPTSPKGYILNSEKLRQEIANATNLPVYDVRKL